ncbi:MAG: HAMP domain-containing sensor histidine kinase [Acidobacteriota bacterium]
MLNHAHRPSDAAAGAIIRGMKLRREASWMVLLTLTLVVLLGVLAVLQYRWMGQVSRAEKERMQASLRAGAENFSRDFDREIARAHFTFDLALPPDLSPPSNSISEMALRIAGKHHHWQQTAPFPGLIKAVYFSESGRDSTRLFRFDSGSGELHQEEWPAELEGLKHSLEPPVAQNSTQSMVVFHRPINLLDDRLPALIQPVLHLREVRWPVTPPMEVTARYLVLWLDREYISKTLIPGLARRYFSGSAGLDYRILVLNRSHPEELVYESEPGLTASLGKSSDASVDLFQLRLNEFNTLFFNNDVTVARRQPLPRTYWLERAERRELKLEGATIRVVHGPEVRDRLAFGAVAVQKFEEPGGRWELKLSHRSGSLDQAVGAARQRNLFVSFGILLLLGASMALIVLLNRRVRRLAEQQIEFVSGVSHELRTPVAVICSASENLADGIVDDPGRVQRYGAMIRNEARRLGKMVEQVLDFAGIQSGRKIYDFQTLEVARLIEDAVESCRPLLDEHEVQVQRAIPPQLPAIRGDHGALLQTLQNLILNAMKYGGQSRWVGLKATTQVDPEGVFVEISVEDRGIGIDTTEIPRIFEPFYRGKAAMAAQIRGNGLGLSLVRHIVRAHKGSVRVESQSGKGSSFTVRLPALPPAEEREDQASESTLLTLSSPTK